MSEQLHSIEEVLEDLKAGKPVIIVDDESRENEGDLIIAAEFATQENINFMVKYYIKNLFLSTEIQVFVFIVLLIACKSYEKCTLQSLSYNLPVAIFVKRQLIL